MIVKEGKRSGLAATITFSCSECPAEVSLSLSPKLPGSLYEINRSVRNAHERRVRQALVKLCAVLNMPTPMSRSSLSGHQNAIF